MHKQNQVAYKILHATWSNAMDNLISNLYLIDFVIT